jgi:two-component system, OmpR family, response regulator
MTTQQRPIPTQYFNGATTPVAMTFILDGPDATAVADKLATFFHHSAGNQSSTDVALHGPAVVIDTTARLVRIDARPVPLTRREFDLLLHLARHPSIAFTRLQLLETVWGHTFSGDRTVDVHIRRLRVKLGRHRNHIATLHRYGYRFEPSPQFTITS